MIIKLSIPAKTLLRAPTCPPKHPISVDKPAKMALCPPKTPNRWMEETYTLRVIFTYGCRNLIKLVSTYYKPKVSFFFKINDCGIMFVRLRISYCYFHIFPTPFFRDIVKVIQLSTYNNTFVCHFYLLSFHIAFSCLDKKLHLWVFLLITVIANSDEKPETVFYIQGPRKNFITTLFASTQ